MTAVRRTVSVLRGLVALAVLIALVAGVPFALVATIGNPVPGDWRATQSLSDEAILGLISCVAWVVWAQLVACVVVEMVAEVRLATGRTAHWLGRLPGTFGGQQAFARTLVQTVVAIGATGALVGATPPWTAPAEAVEPPPVLESSVTARPNSAVVDAQQSTQVAAVKVTVERGDSLWSIAERELGAGERWREIAELNAGRQVGRGVTFDDARAIEPGWVLLVPATPNINGPRETVIVERGDTLWEIAEEQYGDGGDWPRIYSANQQKIDDPHWIYPGQEFVVPVDRPSDVEEPGESPEAAPDDQEPPVEVEPPAASEEPEPNLPEQITPTPEVEPSDVHTESAAGDGWRLDSATVARALLGGGGFLASGMLMVYAARRRTQSRNRRSGRLAPGVAVELRAEDRALRTIGTSALAPAAYFDAALRELAQEAERRGLALPETVAARIDADRLDLYLVNASLHPPDPWVVSHDGRTWSLSRTHLPAAAERLSPYPAMVTLGDDASGGTLFVDLEGVGVTQVVGDLEAGADLVRFLAAELALNPWTATEEVTLVGVAEETVLLNPGQFFVSPKLDFDQLAKQARQVREQATMSGRGVLPSRLDQGRDAYVPTVTLAEVQATSSVRSRVEDLLDEMDRMDGRTSVTLLVLSPAALTDRSVTLTIEDDGRLHTPWGEVTGNRLTSDEASTLCHLLDDADRQGDEPIPPMETDDNEAVVDLGGALLETHTEKRCATGDPYSILPKPDRDYIESTATTEADLSVLAPAVPQSVTIAELADDPELDADLAEWELTGTSRPRLRVIGPVELRAVGERTREVESRPAYYAELTAYLNCHPHGLTPNQFATDFGIQNNTLHTRLGQLRKWLSTKPESNDWYLPNAQWIRGQKAYRLDGILADDDLFRRLRARAQAKGPAGIGDLRNALSLVVGPPYDQQRAKGYGWLVDVPHDHYLTAAIVDVAHIVATHALATGDANLALWAAEKAILAAPSEDKPRLDLAQAIKMMGRADEAEDYLDKQVFNRSDDDRPPLDPSARTKFVTDRPRSGGT